MRIVARGSGSEDIPVFHFWNADSAGIDPDDDGAEVRSKWNMFLGLLIAVAVSGSFWGGVGWLIARLAR